MWALAQNLATLVFRGKLFAEPRIVYGRLGLGILVTAFLFILALKSGMPHLLAALLAGSVGGALQPYLFRDIRYR